MNKSRQDVRSFKDRKREFHINSINGIVRNSTLVLLGIVLISKVFDVEIANTSMLVLVSILMGATSFCFTGVDILNNKMENDLIQIKLIEEIYILNNVLDKIEKKFDCKGIIEETRKEFYELENKTN